jgi:hypothetical protein
MLRVLFITQVIGLTLKCGLGNYANAQLIMSRTR